MDIATYLRSFENSLSSYTGDDPLDQWDKFVENLERRLPADSRDEMSLVFDSLVQRFINAEQYANDIRYVNYCIKFASYYSDPVAVYSHIYNKGIGTRTASLYVAWAQQFEHWGMNEQADAVYQRAMENQAHPADAVLNEYRRFQSRTKSQTHVPEAGVRTPLRNSHLTNQIPSHREPVPQNKVPVECPPKPPTRKTTIIVSRSETSGTIPSSQNSGIKVVSEYMTEELVCEGSEFCFEEVRAERYFKKLREEQEQAQVDPKEGAQGMVSTVKEAVQEWKFRLQKVEAERFIQPSLQWSPAADTASNLNLNPPQQLFDCPQPFIGPSNRKSLGLRVHIEPTVTQDASAVRAGTITVSSAVSFDPSVLPDRSIHLPESTTASPPSDQGSVAQTSMVQAQFVQQPASFELMNQSLHRLIVRGDDLCQTDQCQQEDARPQEHSITHQDIRYPSEPDENLNSVIMDMFQAPTLLEDPFSNTSVLQAAEREVDPICTGSAAAQFTIFQDNDDKENSSAAAPLMVQKPKPLRSLSEIPVSNKPNDTPPDLMPDESTMWGARFNSLNSLAACPNSTTDFAMLAQFVSTPSTHKTPINGVFFSDQENNCDAADAEDDAYLRRQTKKLSPIIEQSPSNETLSETAISKLAPSSERHGTIVGEGLAPAPSLCLTSSSITMVQPPPPGVLSFRDQTICPTEASIPRSTGPSWEVYTSPEQPPKHDSVIKCQPESPVRRRSEAFTIMQDLDEPASPEKAQQEVYDVPMSPESALKPDWPPLRSPEVTAEPDLDAFLSPQRRLTGNYKSLDVPMSPEQQQQACADVPMSPLPQFIPEDEVMASPEKAGASACMSERTGSLQLVSDPWDDELISYLLSNLNPPLSAHPRCVTWQCNLPSISPNVTISMGNASLRVSCVLGEGAFATVYLATDPKTSEKMVLKVQKPANPWEFYINTQLDARLQPDVRHLYSSLRSAHLFKNGSVLLGELHNYGTLLNTVNIYKTLSDKVMPQPLVMYFTICILHMVEKLHSINIVHADIKPDNFLLGERFLENKCFDPENVDHGLALIDLGQSIDMELFPRGTAFTGKCLTSGFQCTEMQSGRPWNYQTDYFGIAGTVHCMLFGTYMQVTNEGGVWKTNGVFRRNPHSDLWLDFFHTLLNIPDCSSLPSLQSLRWKLSSVLQQSYSSKLPTLKSRLVVMLLESRKNARR